MQHAQWMAAIFGPMLAIFGVWALLRIKEVDTYWTSIKASPGLLIMGGMINLMIGIVVLNFYHTWMWDLALLVTLFGYWSLIRGLFVLFFTERAIHCINTLVHHKQVHLIGLIPLVWGLALSYFAFHA